MTGARSRILSCPWYARLLVALVVAGAGCDKEKVETDNPGDDPGTRMEASENAVGATAPQTAAADPKAALPTILDRDPEEEKRKMATSRAQSAKARAALESSDLDLAISLARAALRIHEQNVDAMLVIAEAYFKQGKYEIVQAVTTSGLAVDSKIRTPAETSSLHNLQGFAFVKMNKDSQATQSFKQAAESDEENAAAWNNLGTRYLEAGDVSTAASCFQYAVDLDRNFYKAYLNLGAAQRAQGKWKEAEASILTALKQRPSYPEAYFNLGILYLDADPFPDLSTVDRLNKAISNLTKYKGLSSAGTTTSRTGRGPDRMARSDAATHTIADDYIRVANKGLEREQRRIEREGRAATPGASESGAADDGTSEGDAPAAVAPQRPGGPPAAQTPAPAGPAAPAKPAVQPPAAPTPAPAKPTPTAPAPQKPGTPTPAAPAPTPAAPAPQKPAAPAPQKPAAPAPQKPAAPAPQKPAAPAPQKPAAPAPQKPAAPAPQKPAAPAPQHASRGETPSLASSRSSISPAAEKKNTVRGTREADSTLTLRDERRFRVTRSDGSTSDRSARRGRAAQEPLARRAVDRWSLAVPGQRAGSGGRSDSSVHIG